MPHLALLRLSAIPIGLAVCAACMPVQHTWDAVEEFDVQKAGTQTPAQRDPTKLRVLTWNLKFAGARTDFFFDGWGERVHLSDREAKIHMDGILRLIDETQPDILLSQEVDINSTRSAYINMVDIILDSTDFNYAAWVPVWQVDYIPEEGLGKVEMGQAVFSKWPIVRNTRVDLPQSTESSTLVNTFWLHRAIQLTEIDTGDRIISVVNNHPTAYDLDGTKTIHLEMIYEWSKEMFPPLVVGGDLNVIPPGSLKTEGFADNAPSDTPGVTEVAYTQEEMDALLPYYDSWKPAVPLEDYQVDTLDEQRKFFTHSVSGEVFWTQKLDYLFTDARWSDPHTLQSPGDGNPALFSDPMKLSDHAPMIATLELP